MNPPRTNGQRPSLHGMRTRFIAEERVLEPASRRRFYVTSIVLVGFGVVCFTAILASVLQHNGLTVVDAPVQDWLFGMRSPTLTAIMIGLAIVFGPVALPILLLVVCVVWGIIGKHGRRPLILASAMLVGVLLGQVIGHAVDRHRPPTDLMLFGPDPSFSFPSGHVLGASDFVLLTAYLVFSRRRSIRGAMAGFGFALLCIVAAAVSRVYLGYHWATDVMASVSLSLVILGSVIAYDTWRSLRASGELQITIPHSAE
ncbi:MULTISPECIES: phosphatase PAP2 family protein [Cryobacterium]|nr:MULTISPECIES: phosphatase PAP2 family protein [Cryobacterium]MDY7527775.1 phosphatase PAP2 family protein [Cryobacterium sp. 10C2]MEB0001723.1 phosphatase PAP2 family protein [Cryobacterium sp. RTC2.1]MEB0289083.1 phosphatase PAP2 family protein [Cryobacterium sp. 10C2]MEB0304777.1 phosphatase PAP2 family protein [Cryobacterium sp. 10I1]WPX15197.1 phosphatase PAP2 family protein [Cryobacterium sp. 10S3]